MKRILSLIFVSVFAIAFSAGFFACKKDKPAEESIEKTEEAAPAADEKKEEKKEEKAQ